MRQGVLDAWMRRNDGHDEETPSHKRARTFAPPLPPAPSSAKTLLQAPAAPRVLTTAGWYNLGDGAVLGYWPRALDHLARLTDALMKLPWERRDVVVMGRRVAQPRRVCYLAESAAHSYTYSGLTLGAVSWGAADAPVCRIKAELEALLAREAAELVGSGGGGSGGAGSGSAAAAAGAAAGAAARGYYNNDDDDDNDAAAARAAVRRAGAARFNSCLCNRYEDGGEYVGWHRDDEPGLGARPLIASVSFGGARDFVLREAERGGGGSGSGGGSSSGGFGGIPGQQRRIVVKLAAGDVLVMAGTLQRHWQHTIPKRAKLHDVPRVSLTFREMAAPRS